MQLDDNDVRFGKYHWLLAICLVGLFCSFFVYCDDTRKPKKQQDTVHVRPKTRTWLEYDTRQVDYGSAVAVWYVVDTFLCREYMVIDGTSTIETRRSPKRPCDLIP